MKTILLDAVYCFIIEKEEGKFIIFEDMYKLLETYPNKKIILTGANDEQMVKFGLDKVPYEVFTLKHNPEKTDPEYYKTLLNKFNLTKDEVIYFEHSMEALKSAQSVGIDSYYYDNDKKDLDGLKNFLDEKLK
jgi:HAD superfamily hydrolase (TIGR01509 family)